MNELDSALIIDCHEYVRQHRLQAQCVINMQDEQPYAMFYYYKENAFTFRKGRCGFVYVEIELNFTKCGWFTCTTLDEFKRVFDEFADQILIINDLHTVTISDVAK